MKIYETNNEVLREALREAQNAIIARGDIDPNYPVERHLEDMDLIADLTELRRKYTHKNKI